MSYEVEAIFQSQRREYVWPGYQRMAVRFCLWFWEMNDSRLVEVSGDGVTYVMTNKGRRVAAQAKDGGTNG